MHMEFEFPSHSWLIAVAATISLTIRTLLFIYIVIGSPRVRTVYVLLITHFAKFNFHWCVAPPGFLYNILNEIQSP